MKFNRVIYFLLAVCVLSVYMLFPISSSATNINSSVIYFDDGSYLIVTIEEDDSISTFATTKSYSKTYTHYANNNVQWQFILTGKFQYDGTTSKCTSVSHSTANIASGWRLDNYTIWADGNKARGEAIFKKKLLFVDVDTKEIDMTITCDKNGNIS